MNPKKEEFDLIQIFAGLVYVAGVGVAVILFMNYVISAFPDDEIGTRLIMSLGVILVGASSVALPLYIHQKTIERNHRTIAILLYAGEIIIMGVNVTVSFTYLLSLGNGAILMPQWMLRYEPYSVFSIVYVVATWAILFSTDPAYKERDKIKRANQRMKELEAKRIELDAEQEEKIYEKEKQYLDSIEGEDFLVEIAKKRIAQRRKLQDDGPKHFGSGRLESVAYLQQVNGASAKNAQSH